MNNKFKKSKALLALTLIFALLLPNFAFAEDLTGSSATIDSASISLRGGKGNLVLNLNNGNTPDWVSWLVYDMDADQNSDDAMDYETSIFPGNVTDLETALTKPYVFAGGYEKKKADGIISADGLTATIPVNVPEAYWGKQLRITTKNSIASGNGAALRFTVTTDANGNTNDPLPNATSDLFQAADSTYTGSGITPVVSVKTAANAAKVGTITVTGVTGTSAAGTQGTDVGTYTVTFDTAGGTDYAATTGLTVTWKITKATPPVPDLVATGATANGASDGKITINNYDAITGLGLTLKYGDTNACNSAVTGKDITGLRGGVTPGKSYWVKVIGNANYNDGTAVEVKVTEPKALTPVTANDFTITAVTYDKGAKAPVADGQLKAKAGKTAGVITVTDVQPKVGPAGATATTATNAGTYVVTFNVAAAGDFAAATDLTIDWTINKATITGKPAITDNNGGNYAAGTVLTAGKGNMNAELADVDYEWFVGGTATGTKNTTYTIQASDNGKNITVKATAKADGNYTGTVESDPVVPGKAAITGKPAISGTTAKGDTLTAEKGTMNADLANVNLQWNRDGEAIPGATGETYVITAADLGKNITVTATPKADSDFTGTGVTSDNKAIPAVKPDAPKPTVSASNKKLTVTWPKPFDGGSPITGYKVTINGVEIAPAPGADDTSIVITKDENNADLVNGTEYTITVVATNAVGDSDPGEVKGTPKAVSGSIGGGSSSSGSTYYDVTYEVGKKGEISGKGAESVKANAYPNKVPTVTAKEGYEFKGWSVDGKTIVDPTDVRITKDTTFTAIFESTKQATLNSEDHIVYIRGYEDGTFAPNKSITRAEAITIFARLMNEKMDVSETYTASFSDVKAGAWYANYIGYMEDYNIINGYEDGTFRPDAAITRAEFAAMASRFDKLESTDKNAFSDVGSSHWAIESINSAYAKGWIGGYPDGTFRPNQNISRAEVVSIVNSMLARKIDASSIADATYKTFPDVASNHWAYYDVIEASNEHDYDKDDAGKNTWK